MSDVLVLSAQIVRGLNDKAYEKRKAAALEVEKYALLVFEFVKNTLTVMSASLRVISLAFI